MQPPTPKYFQIAQDLMQLIKSGKLETDAKLPTEYELCQQYGVSRGTVRQAIQQLDSAGLVHRRQGNGTFVIPKTGGSALFTLAPFSDSIRRQGRMPSARVLTAVTQPASREIAKKLQLSEQESVIQISRLRLADGRPIAHETRYLAQWLCPHLLDEDLEHSSIHDLLVNKYQVSLVKMTHTVEATMLTDKQKALFTRADSEALGLKLTPTAAFMVDRLTYTIQQDEQIPAVWFKAIYLDHRLDIGADIRPSL